MCGGNSNERQQLNNQLLPIEIPNCQEFIYTKKVTATCIVGLKYVNPRAAHILNDRYK